MNKQHQIFSRRWKNGALPFLDIKIYRQNGKFVTGVYSKETFSGVCRNIASFIPLEYKFDLSYTLFKGRNYGWSTDMTGQILLHVRPELSFFFIFDIATTALCSFSTPLITCLLNDVKSFCNRNLMVLHWTHVARLLSAFSTGNENIYVCKLVLL